MTSSRSCAAAPAPTERRADPEAFERSTLPVLPDVIRFARSLTRDATSADDLVQETYLKALRYWHTFREGSDARRWLLTICHHTFLRTSRREARYVAAPDYDPELESMATAVAHWHAQEAGVAEVVERMDLRPALDRAIASLPANFRAAVALVDIEGLSYEDAAGVLGVPLGTVRSRLFRARRLLQDMLFLHAQDAGLVPPKPDTDRTPNLSRPAE